MAGDIGAEIDLAFRYAVPDKVLGAERERKTQLTLPPLFMTRRGQHCPGSTEPAPGRR